MNRAVIENIPELLRPPLQACLEQLRETLAHWQDEQWREAARVWAASSFVRQWCLRHPSRIEAMLADDRPAIEQDVEPAAFDASLRRYRNQIMVRIAWQELGGTVSPEHTVQALSDLADECLRRTVDYHLAAMRKRYGQARLADGSPAHFCVIALGKLGGRELNFSSDVDVIFAYSGSGQSDGDKPIANEPYFVRLGQRIIGSLQDRTDEGFVFRVDLRLRPFGEQSALAHSLSSIEQYYEAHGREWERYAWIKARVVAGDLGTGAELVQMLQPFVYRRYLDFNAIAALRDMKGQIDEQVQKRGHEQDVKLGWGGIREVEFIAQVFQLVRGGAEPSLRSASLMKAMDAIGKLGLHPLEDLAALRKAYWFLRRVENCWQAQADQQSHVLPSNEEPRLALACALGYPEWSRLDAELQKQRAIVHAQFAALFAQPDIEDLDPAWQRWWDGEQADNPGQLVPAMLDELRDKAHRRLNRAEDLARFGELLAQLALRFEDETTAQRVLEVVEVLIGRDTYVALLHDSPVARRQLQNLCQQSPWLAQEMRRFPVVLSELLDPIRLYTPDERQVLRERLRSHLDSLPAADIEARMDVIRRTRHATMLRIAAADVSAALPIMHVSDRLSELAEEILTAALDEAVAQMRERYPDLPEPAFSVIAYGKLGGLELSYSSDLDLVFVYDGDQDGLPLEAQVFYTRLARKLIHFLATPTGAGVAYEIDMRLRPSGASGLLVTSIQQLEKYQLEQAWTWEHQALIRARPVAGSSALSRQFEVLRRKVLAQPRDRARLLVDVTEMREKMRENLAPKDGRFDYKQSPGGLVDIEFFTQFAVLAYAAAKPQISRYTDVVRILESLQSAELIYPSDAEMLSDAYRQLRNLINQGFLTGVPAERPEGLDPVGLSGLVGRLQQELTG